MEKRNYAEITPTIRRLAGLCAKNDYIEPDMYSRYQVNRGLRDLNGKGILTGLTEISEICSKKPDGQGGEIPCRGELYYRGYEIHELTDGFLTEKRFGFEETVYLLLFGELPDRAQLAEFTALLESYRSLPTSFVRDLIMKAPSSDMMNSLARSVLTMYSYDNNPDDIGIPNVLRQCLQLIAVFPLLSVYGYRAFEYYRQGGDSLFIHEPEQGLSTAETLLSLLRIDRRYSALEARVLDLALVLHAEHGGGNNSTFTTHVVSSSGTDTYSAVAAALGSLKGPRHGGANLKVCGMMRELKATVRDWRDEEEVAAYLRRILHREAFDRSGLIYGMGHAIYSVSDPRAEIFRGFVGKLAAEKQREAEFGLYDAVARLAPQVIASERKIYKGVSANVDFYSGFVYTMLGLPEELFTPIFAVARIAGWSAHRLEELVGGGKILRPSYMAVHPRRKYRPMRERGPISEPGGPSA